MLMKTECVLEELNQTAQYFTFTLVCARTKELRLTEVRKKVTGEEEQVGKGKRN